MKTIRDIIYFVSMLTAIVLIGLIFISALVGYKVVITSYLW